MNAAATEAIGTQLPTLIDITTVPSEAEVPCRTASALPFVGNGGIFLSFTKSAITLPNPRGGAPIELITVDLKLNTAHRIKPGATVPNCNMDGVMYLPAKSVNVKSVAEPQYIRSGADQANPNAVTNVKIFFTRIDRTKPATIGIRVKFEEGVGQTANFNPKRANGTVTFP
jgi:hypothetical protein